MLIDYLPVVAETPYDSTEAIENVLENCNSGVEVVVIDEG